MMINFERIESQLKGKVDKTDIIKITNQFREINDVIELRRGIENSVVKYLQFDEGKKDKLDNIKRLQMEIRGLENESILLVREEFDELRKSGKLMEFLWGVDVDKLEVLVRLGCIRSEEMGDIKTEKFKLNRDENNKNYNKIKRENVGMSNKNIWK